MAHKKKAKDSKKNNLNTSLSKYYLLFFGLFLVVSAFLLNIYYDFGAQKKEDINAVEVVEKAKPTPTKVVEQINKYLVPNNFTSTSYIVYDENAQKIDGGLNVDKKVANASTTKLMSAYVAYNYFPLDYVISIPIECTKIEGSNAGLKEGEKYYFEDLLYAILLQSAADATCAVSYAYPGGEAAFIEKMNSQAKDFNLTNTNYVNSIGLDAPNHYSTSRDLLNLIIKLKKVNKLSIVMGSRSYVLTEQFSKRVVYIANTNEMLFKLPGTVGYKTGTTDEAGECIVYGYVNGDISLIIVVMGSKSRFYDVASLLDIFLQKNTNIINKPIINEATKIFTPVIKPTPLIKN